MRVNVNFKLCFFTWCMVLLPVPAWAGDGATILFREGQLAYVNNGYSTLVNAYKKLNTKNTSHQIVELKIESSPFLINLSEVVIICRDRCTSLEVKDPRRTPDESRRSMQGDG